MAIAIPTDIQRKKTARMFNLGVLFLGLLFFIYTLIPAGKQGEVAYQQSRQGVQCSYQTIGSGPLALNGMRSYIPLPSLRTELMLLGKNARPDAIQKTVLLGLKSSNEEKVVLEGETVYLRTTGQDQLSFSTEKTSLAIRPILLEEGVLIEVGKGEEQGSLLIKDVAALPSREEPVYASTLKKAVAWGHDILLQNYGGEEYFSFREKMRLEFGEGPSSYVCFIEPGDLLIWTDERWQPISLENFSHHLPLARVTAASSREVDIEAWDETGFHQMNMKISMKMPTRLPAKLDEMFTALKPRTSSEITCLLGKKRVVLKEGDWWLKTDSGWHKLKSFGEIEDLLQHKIRGELVIFDQMESEKGKAILKGHLFDPMRTYMQPITLTVSGDKKSRVAGKKKVAAPALARGHEIETKP